MGIGIRPYVAAGVVVLFVASSVLAQNPRTVRWKEGDPNSDKFVSSGVTVKRVRTDGITVRASMTDGISVSVDISNDGQTPVEIRPESLTLDVVSPRARGLAYIPADRVADAAVAMAHNRAAMVEFSGSMATKTVTETHTTWSDSPTAPISQRTMAGETPHVVTTTTTRTVPDDSARSSASTQASSIRNGASSDRQRVLAAALKPATLAPTFSASGVVWFEREKDPKEVLLRVPVGDLVVEVPFTVSKRRLALWVKINEFK